MEAEAYGIQRFSIKISDSEALSTFCSRISHTPSSVMMKLFLLFLVILPLVLSTVSYRTVDEWEAEKRALFKFNMDSIINTLKAIVHSNASKSVCVTACHAIPGIGMFTSLCGLACDKVLHLVR
ncbi:hypothetical protein ScPMuIL_000291 [Solemya velum]